MAVGRTPNPCSVGSTPASPAKVLIAVTTCHKFDYDMRSINDCLVLHRSGMDFKTPRPPFIRATWWNDVPETVGKKFFYGRPSKVGLDDEVFLDVPDDYAHLPYKTRALCKWAFENGYTHLFKTDDDSFVYVDRLLKSGFEKYPWIGRYNGGDFVAGGPGYWLNREAMLIAATAPIPQQDWAEDIWISKMLQRSGFQPHFDPRYVDLRRSQVESSTVAVCECTWDKMKALYETRRGVTKE
jgi:hypothetical protein